MNTNRCRWSIAVGLGIAAGLLVGCGEGAEPSASVERSDDQSVEFHRYTVRGEVVEVEPKLRIRHEAIPEFRGPSGKLGMNVMVMDFWPPVPSRDGLPVPARVPESPDGLDGLEPGQRVSVRFEVQFDLEADMPRGYFAVDIEELPGDVELDFTPLPRVDVYETRGQITATPGVREDKLIIRHEAVPEFRNPDGSSGMDVMNMPFWPPVRAGSLNSFIVPTELDLESFEVGDKVLVRWEVQSDRASGDLLGYYATKLTPLPDDTELDFRSLAELEAAGDENE